MHFGGSETCPSQHTAVARSLTALTKAGTALQPSVARGDAILVADLQHVE